MLQFKLHAETSGVGQIECALDMCFGVNIHTEFLGVIQVELCNLSIGKL